MDKEEALVSLRAQLGGMAALKYTPRFFRRARVWRQSTSVAIAAIFGEGSEPVQVYAGINKKERYRLFSSSETTRRLLVKLMVEVHHWPEPGIPPETDAPPVTETPPVAEPPPKTDVRPKQVAGASGRAVASAPRNGVRRGRCEGCWLTGVRLYACYPHGRGGERQLLCKWCRDALDIEPGHSEDVMDAHPYQGGFETNPRKH